MSEIRVDKIISHAGNSAPDFPQGANLSGVTTVSSMKVGSGITADSSGLNVTGIVTASGFVGGVTGNVTGSSSPTVKINDGATEKGYIGFNGNDPFIGRKDGVGLAFQNNKVRPVDGDDGSASNNTVDLGEPTYKFKDLHLAGDASIAGSISGVSSVTATTFYGSGAGLSGVGIGEIDQWYLTEHKFIAGGSTVALMSSDLTRAGTANGNFAVKGTGMAYASGTGIWTFPSTGYWQLGYTLIGDGVAEGNYLHYGWQLTTNNSTYTETIQNGTEHIGSGSLYWQVSGTNMFRITDVSNQKVKFFFRHSGGGNLDLFGGDQTSSPASNHVASGWTFVKLSGV